MKSLRLRRRKHTKSRKLRTRKLRSRKLRTRKLRSRKLRKGGNGPSSSSSQDNFQILLGLLDSYPTYIRDISDLSREVPMDNIKIRQIQNDLNDIENRIVSIFRNNSFDISTLSEEQKDALLYAILRTNGEIAEEYANAYSNVETKEQMPIEIIDQLIAQHHKGLFSRQGGNFLKYGRKCRQSPLKILKCKIVSILFF